MRRRTGKTGSSWKPRRGSSSWTPRLLAPPPPPCSLILEGGWWLDSRDTEETGDLHHVSPLAVLCLTSSETRRTAGGVLPSGPGRTSAGPLPGRTCWHSLLEQDSAGRWWCCRRPETRVTYVSRLNFYWILCNLGGVTVRRGVSVAAPWTCTVCFRPYLKVWLLGPQNWFKKWFLCVWLLQQILKFRFELNSLSSFSAFCHNWCIIK